MMREPSELDLLTEEQELELQNEPPRRKPVGRPPKDASRMMARQYKRKVEEVVRPMPAWMSDPSLLPKRPPGR